MSRGYQGAPISHLMDVLADAQDIMGELGVHFESSASEATAAATLAASVHYPIRGAVTFKSHRRHQRRIRCAGQPRLRRREGRRAHHRRRGLRRRLLHHAGAQPRFCDEVADLAARSAPEPREDRAVRARRLRAVGSLQHAGDAGGAHPLLPRAWPLHGARQPASEDEPRRGAGEPAARPEPHRAAASLLSPREGEDREALASGGEVHPRARL